MEVFLDTSKDRASTRYFVSVTQVGVLAPVSTQSGQLCELSSSQTLAVEAKAEPFHQSPPGGLFCIATCAFSRSDLYGPALAGSAAVPVISGRLL